MARPRIINPRHEPPLWSRRKMIETAIYSGLGVIAVGTICFLMLTSDLEQREVDKKAERALKEMGTLRFHLLSYRIDNSVFPPEEDRFIPEWFVEVMKEQMGGAPLHGEQAKYARLDPFSQPIPYSEPLGYFPGDGGFVLFSRGPDLDFDFVYNGIVGQNDDLTSAVMAWSYDPTNGAYSGGDIIIPILDE